MSEAGRGRVKPEEYGNRFRRCFSVAYRYHPGKASTRSSALSDVKISKFPLARDVKRNRGRVQLTLRRHHLLTHTTTNEFARRPTSCQHQIFSMPHLAMSIYITKYLVDFSPPNLYGPSSLNYPTYIRQRDSCTILAIANKKRSTVAYIKVAQSLSAYQETTSYSLQLDVSKYSAVRQATRSTPSRTQLT